MKASLVTFIRFFDLLHIIQFLLALIDLGIFNVTSPLSLSSLDDPGDNGYKRELLVLAELACDELGRDVVAVEVLAIGSVLWDVLELSGEFKLNNDGYILVVLGSDTFTFEVLSHLNLLAKFLQTPQIKSPLLISVESINFLLFVNIIGFTVFNLVTKSFSFTRLTSRFITLSKRTEQQAQYLYLKIGNCDICLDISIFINCTFHPNRPKTNSLKIKTRLLVL